MKKLISLCLVLLFSNKNFAQTIMVFGASDYAVNHTFVFDISHNHYHYIDNALKDYFFEDAGNDWIIYNLCDGCKSPQTLYTITSPRSVDPPCYGVWVKAIGNHSLEFLTIMGTCVQNNFNNSLLHDADFTENSKIQMKTQH